MAQPAAAQSLSLEAITPDGSWLTLEPGQGQQYLPEGSLLLTPWGTTEEGSVQIFSPEGELSYDIHIGEPPPEQFGSDGLDWDSGWYDPLPIEDLDALAPYGGYEGLGLDPGYFGGYGEAVTTDFDPPDSYILGIPTNVPGISVGTAEWSSEELFELDTLE